MKQGVVGSNGRTWRGVRKESIQGTQSGKVGYSDGVKPRSSGIGDKAVDPCVL